MSIEQRFREALRASRLSILANFAFAVVKFTAGVFGNSYALIADAMESILDAGGSIVVLGGLKVAAAPPDSDHPYGHGKAEPLAAAMLSILMIAAAMFLAVESIEKIRTPHPNPAPFTLIVLAAVIGGKEMMFRHMRKVSKSSGSTAIEVDAWHHRSDMLTSAAAFIGIAIAVYKGPGYEAADDWAALATCFILAWNGYQLIKPSISDIMDAAPSPELEERVRNVASSVPNVLGLDKCYIRKYGLSYLVDLHVVVAGDSSVREGHTIAHAVKDALREAEPTIADVLVHIEPAD